MNLKKSKTIINLTSIYWKFVEQIVPSVSGAVEEKRPDEILCGLS
jgi:hypothetical protein